MTTLRQIVTDALRESGIIAVGTTPEADELDEGFRRLQNLINSILNQTLGEIPSDLMFGSQGITNQFSIYQDVSSIIRGYYIPQNTRLILNLSSSENLSLPPNPSDGARITIIDNAGNLAAKNVVLSGNGRRIEDSSSVTLNTNSLNRSWFYRADLGNWQVITDLDVGDSSPFPDEFDDLLIMKLALRLNPRYGAATSQETAEMLRDAMKQFSTRYKQSKEEPSELAISRLSFANGLSCEGADSTTRFDRGLTWI